MQDPWVYPAGLFLRGESSTRAGLRKSQPDASGVQSAPASRLSLWESWHLRQQMTERAKSGQVRVRANLKSHVSWFQPSLSLRDISPKGRDKFGLRIKPKPSSLRKVARRKP